MNAAVTSDTAPPLFVFAYSGEEDGLEQTLRSLDTENTAVTAIVGSDDRHLRKIAESIGTTYITGLPEKPQADRYWCTVLEALPEQEGRFLVLRAGALVPRFWLQRLSVAVTDSAAAVFPLSVRHPCSSIFDSVSHTPGIGVDVIDTWLNQYASGCEFDIPVFSGQSALLRPELVPPGEFEDDLSLSVAIRENGGLILCTDNVYIDDSCMLPGSLGSSVYSAWKDAILQRHPLTGLRHAMTELSTRGELPGTDVIDVRPVRLHVSHGWGGGLSRWVEDFVHADQTCHNYVLRPIGDYSAFGQTLALYSSADLSVPVQSWTLTTPIVSTVISHFEYRRLLDQIMEKYDVKTVMISSLIGHSMDVFDVVSDITVISHDFYPFCPPILATYKTPCSSCDSVRMEECLENNPGHRFFLVEPSSHWEAIRKHYMTMILRDSIHMVAPSQSVINRMRELMPELGEKPMAVIEHGLPAKLIAELSCVTRSHHQSKPLRIVILGSLEVHKGASLLQDVVAELSTFSNLLLLGVGEGGRSFSSCDGVRVIERYERNDLGEILGEFQPDLGLLLSSVPETFSYTLSELQAASIPVAATNIGAFTDRIEHNYNGWLYEPNAQNLLALLESLRNEPQKIVSVAETLRGEKPRDAASMVEDYNQHCSLGQLLGIHRPSNSPLGNPHMQQGSLYIDPEATFSQVTADFINYAKAKVKNTPRMSRHFKRAVLFFLNLFSRG